MPVFQNRRESAGKFALVTAGRIPMTVLAAALLVSCAKVEAIEQDKDGNYPSLIEQPVSIPTTEPVIITNDATPNIGTNEAISQGEASERPR